MKERQRRVDNIRRRSSNIQNHLIDEYSAGKISRREFIRRGTILGASLPLMSFLAAACGPGDAATTTAAGATTTAAVGTTAAGHHRSIGHHRGGRTGHGPGRDGTAAGRRHRSGSDQRRSGAFAPRSDRAIPELLGL